MDVLSFVAGVAVMAPGQLLAWWACWHQGRRGRRGRRAELQLVKSTQTISSLRERNEVLAEELAARVKPPVRAWPVPSPVVPARPVPAADPAATVEIPVQRDDPTATIEFRAQDGRRTPAGAGVAVYPRREGGPS